MLIQRVYEVDPLECPKCGGAMKIISFIERCQQDVPAGCASRMCQQDVVERLLRHCGLWEGPIRTLASARAPPGGSQGDPDQARELQLVLDSEFLQAQAAESPELQLVLAPEFL